MGFTKLEKDVLNISKLPDSVQGNAKDLKATFDKAGEDIKEAHNKLIDELAEEGAAGNIGAMSEDGPTTVQDELDKLNERIHVDFTELEIELDDELDVESENAVKNKVIAKEVNAVKGETYTSGIYNFLETAYEDIEEVKVQDADLLADMKLTSNTTCENKYVKVTATGYSNTSFPLTNAFDKNETTEFRTDSSYYPSIEFVFKKAIKINKIKLKTAGSNSAFKRLSLKASKDGTYFTTLYETTVFTEESREIILQNTDFYKYYYLEAKYANGYLYLYDFSILEWEGALYEATVNLDTPLTSYKKGKIANVEISPVIEKAKYRIVEEFTTNIIPIMNGTYNEQDYGIWYCYGGTDSYKAFDGNDSTYWYGGTATSAASSVSISSLKKVGSNSQFAIKPRKIVISSARHTEGSVWGTRASDGVAVKFGTIPANSSTTAVQNEFEIQTDEYYNRIYASIATSKDGNYPMIYKFDITEGTLAEGIFSDQVEAEFSSFYLNINKLGLKAVNGIVQANRKNTLVYNGETWDLHQEHIVGMYTGDGDSTEMVFDFGFIPKAIVITGVTGSKTTTYLTYVFPELGQRLIYYINSGGDSSGYSATVTIEGTKIKMSPSISNTNAINVKNNIYRYIVYR